MIPCHEIVNFADHRATFEKQMTPTRIFIAKR